MLILGQGFRLCKAILQAKEVYRIDKKEDTLLSEEEKLKEQAAVEQFNRLRNKNK